MPEEADGGGLFAIQRMKPLAAYKFKPPISAHAGGRTIWVDHLLSRLAAERRAGTSEAGGGNLANQLLYQVYTSVFAGGPNFSKFFRRRTKSRSYIMLRPHAESPHVKRHEEEGLKLPFSATALRLAPSLARFSFTPPGALQV